jgi:hypothetical protein
LTKGELTASNTGQSHQDFSAGTMAADTLGADT